MGVGEVVSANIHIGWKFFVLQVHAGFTVNSMTMYIVMHTFYVMRGNSY